MCPKNIIQFMAALVVAVVTPATSQADGLRIPFVGSLQGSGQVTLPIIPPSDPNAIPLANPAYWSNPEYVSRCGGAPVLETEAAGNTSLLGLVQDYQVHCLGDPTVVNGELVLPFFNGKFTFTDHKRRYITGEYSGVLTPTLTSRPPPGPFGSPSGTWQVEGEVCVRAASPQLHIADDCAANRFFPARGVTDPSAGTAAIYLNQTLGIRH